MDTASPDAQAAAYDPTAVTGAVGDLSDDDAGSVIAFEGEVAVLLDVTHYPPMVDLLVRLDGQPFDSSRRLHRDVSYVVVTAPAKPAAMLDTAGFEKLAREFDALGARIEALDAEIPVLKKRRQALADRLEEHLAAVGERSAGFDRRRIYLYPQLVPEFEERPDGRKYTMRDLAPVLRALGFGPAVKPEEAGYNALLKIFRDHEREGKPLPPALLAMVHPRRVDSVRAGVGKTGKTR